jgi:hypothetical protein
MKKSSIFLLLALTLPAAFVATGVVFALREVRLTPRQDPTTEPTPQEPSEEIPRGGKI